MTQKFKVLVTRKWPKKVEEELQLNFEATLNESDTPLSENELIEAMQNYDALLPTVTDKISDTILSVANKKVKIVGDFFSFSSLPLDYQNAFKDSKKFIGIVLSRPDQKQIPLVELKLAAKLELFKDEKKPLVIEHGDQVKINAKVYEVALGEPWLEISSIEIVRNGVPEELNKNTIAEVRVTNILLDLDFIGFVKIISLLNIEAIKIHAEIVPLADEFRIGPSNLEVSPNFINCDALYAPVLIA